MGSSYANLFVGFIEELIFEQYSGPKPEFFGRRVSNLWTVINRDSSRLWRELLGGSGGMVLRKFWKLEAIKHHFQHSQAEICGKMALKVGDVFPLTFTYKCGYQVIAPILPINTMVKLEIEKKENRNICSCCTLHTFIHSYYTTVVFSTRLKEGHFVAFTLSMLSLKMNWPQRNASSRLAIETKMQDFYWKNCIRLAQFYSVFPSLFITK